ncbi:MAG: tol-pal system protein YbgF [Rhodospirillales bacterium]|nr:tol-pal system protein YbgF [Rhodospirillales bacterium]
MKSSWGKFAFIFAVGLLATISVPQIAKAQNSDLQSVIDRMLRLERDIKTLNLTVYKGQTPPASAVASGSGLGAAQAGVRMGELESEMRNLAGTVESLAHDIQMMNARIDKLMSDIDFRLSAAGQGAVAQGGTPRVAKIPPTQGVTKEIPTTTLQGGSKPSTFGQVTEEELKAVSDNAPPTQEVEAKAIAQTQQAKPTVVAKAPPNATQVAAPKTLTVAEQYNNARKFLMTGNFDEAEVALTEFLKDNPKDKLAGNARYWLGETHYVRGDYLKSAEIFLEGYRLDPKGNKAADGLLKLGMALGNLDKKREACATFSKLGKEFPRAPSKIKKASDREKKRNGC